MDAKNQPLQEYHVASTAQIPPALTLVWMRHEDSETQRTGLQQSTIRSCHGLAQICSFAP